MGNNEGKLNSGIIEYIRDEFARVLEEPSRDYLTLSQLLQFRPHEDYPFDFRHLSILFICDRTLDSKFSLEDLEHLAEWAQLNLPWVQMYQFKSQMQSRTVSKLIEFLERKDGEAQLSSWFINLLAEDKPRKKIGDRTYVKIEVIKLVYEIFSVQVMTDMDIQSFFFLVKRASQDLGLQVEEMKENEEDDQPEEYIDLTVCKQFLRHFIRGSLKILKEIGYQNSVI